MKLKKKAAAPDRTAAKLKTAKRRTAYPAGPAAASDAEKGKVYLDTVSMRDRARGLAEAAYSILSAERPMTLRQLYYRLVSAGVLSNQQTEYRRLGIIVTRLRERNAIPRTWLVDHTRATLKPSSWTGLADFGETVRDAYRKDLWAEQEECVEILCEKDAVAATIEPITNEYDVALRVCRGYASVSFAGEIADTWASVQKPIFAYYVGDYDPSGFDIERDLRERLARYSRRCLWFKDESGKRCRAGGGVMDPQRYIHWHRLGILAGDFAGFNLIKLPVKPTDRRAAGFIAEHGTACTEIDALPPSELRARVEAAIARHIDGHAWRKLQRVEAAERETMQHFLTSTLAGDNVAGSAVTNETNDDGDGDGQASDVRAD